MTQAQTLFGDALRDVAAGPHGSSFQSLTKNLMRRLSEKGLTLEQCADRKMLNRSRSTLESHCREYGIRFPDYTPSNMRKHVMFVPRGDYLELTGPEVDAVAAALEIATTTRDCVPSCAISAHSFDGAKAALKLAGYEAKKGKKPKLHKVKGVAAHG